MHMTGVDIAEERTTLVSQRPYSPSWFDGFKRFVERLPGPTWAFYVVLGIVVVALEVGLQWSAGNYPVGEFFPFHIVFALQLAYAPAILHYLDRLARRAMEQFRPAFLGTEADFEQARYELTTMPARPALIAALIGLLIAPLGLAFDANMQVNLMLFSTPALLLYNSFLHEVTWLLGIFGLYHIIHQLRQISRIYDKHTVINIQNPRPLYAFSPITAVSAVALPAVYFAWWLTLPVLLSEPISLVLGLMTVGLGVLTFILPLTGIHGKLVDEKARLLGEAAERFAVVTQKLYKGVDENDLREMGEINDAIASLEIEQRVLEKIPTWPWQPETFRLLITALLLPIVLFLIQFLIQRLLAP
jgi:hypothetical protein